MGTEGRGASPDLSQQALLDRLLEAPYRFRFYQAVRLLRRLHPERSLESLVQFQSDASFAFAPSELVSLKAPSTDEGPLTLKVAFMGLLSSRSMLPDHYRERALALARNKDRALLDFLDIFNDRLISLLYQAWEKPRFFVKLERREPDPLTKALEALAGLRLGEQPMSLPFDPDLIRGQAARFMRGMVSEESALEVLRTAFPDIGFELHPFDPQQLPLEDDSRFRLRRGSLGNQLGRFCPLGRRVWDVQSRVRLKVGPLTPQQWQAFAPEGPSAVRLQAIWQRMTGGELDLVVEPSLGSAQHKRWKLGSRSARLGRSVWLGSRGVTQR